MCYVPESELNFDIRIYPAEQFPIGTLITLKCGCVERIRKIYLSGSVIVELHITCSPDHAYHFFRRSSVIADTACRYYYKSTELPNYQFYKLPE